MWIKPANVNQYRWLKPTAIKKSFFKFKEFTRQFRGVFNVKFSMFRLIKVFA